jgi:hypothetical protein|tara:strand:+ start:796 stop:1056 length:261 start_codon:yes stop_codon:yes gene_type:complete
MDFNQCSICIVGNINSKRNNKMNIARCTLDKRGRINLPKTFLQGNYIKPETHEAVIQVVPNNLNTVKLVFALKEEYVEEVNNAVSK